MEHSYACPINRRSLSALRPSGGDVNGLVKFPKLCLLDPGRALN